MIRCLHTSVLQHRKMDTEGREETAPLLQNGVSHQPTLKLQIFAGFCAFASSVVFSCNNLLIQAYNLHCTDLLIIRSIIQVIIFGSLLKLQNIPWWPSWQHYPCAKDYIVETIFVILQVFKTNF